MPLETRNGPQAVYERYLRDGRFMLQRGRKTGKYVFYPRVLVPGTGETDMEWVEASGKGTIYALTVNRSRDESYNVALIDLAEGVRMMSTVVGCESAPIGAAVQAEIEQGEDSARVVFRLADGRASA
jgi:Predicted nucleic-acid-binding protein containing a Zn-ribbon